MCPQKTEHTHTHTTNNPLFFEKSLQKGIISELQIPIARRNNPINDDKKVK